MDGHESGCEEGEGRVRCDLCQLHAQQSKGPGVVQCEQAVDKDAGHDQARAGRAEEQAQRYAVGPQLVRKRVQEQEAERVRVEQAVREIGRGCASCWLRGRVAHGEGEAGAHTTEEYSELKEAIRESYIAVRRQVRFEKGSYCCYRCRLPGEWCVDYSQRQRCTQPDVVVAVAMAAWGTHDGRTWLAGGSQATDLLRVIKWLAQATVVGGSRASRAVKVAEHAVQLREEGRFRGD
ncbi:hypothetical protein B0A48_18718 [Cryoendolithus antarcticus]|uniref:Uncharacterized protein n=1 Tax=Cryoendolithus antarcticus TaxID=1507870 RepID=A0A1V8S8I1_9PEZI|nr:hypothetical protein B0A48_18718 [Cryoendolithus antarcticus]